nr:MAG TPA: hypothetical protein [Bacteriophage sp.]
MKRFLNTNVMSDCRDYCLMYICYSILYIKREN